MITYEMKVEAEEYLVEQWGEDGIKVIETCRIAIPFDQTFNEFLKMCTACGGNWGGMLLTGIKEYDEAVYDAIPENMGVNAFTCICYVLQLLNVDLRG